MPKIFSKDGFVVYFYKSEEDERHHMRHVHIYKSRFGGESLVVTIPELAILHSDLSARDEKIAMQVLVANLQEILRKVE